VIGLGALLLGASGAFGQLQDALNTIWEVQPKPGQGVWGFLRARFLSFSMVLVIGFMLLVTLVVSAALAGFGSFLDRAIHVPVVLLHGVNFLISFAVTSLLFTLIYKVLPDVTIRWKDVIVGGVATAVLFSLGRFLIGLYLGRSSVSSAYGAAGSLVVVLLWIYYSSQILLFGAEFTKVYADAFGGLIRPSPHAEPMAAEARIQQGMPARTTPSPAVAAREADDREPGAGKRRHPVRVRDPSGRKGLSGDRKRSDRNVLRALAAGALGFVGVRRFGLPMGLWILSRLLRRRRHA
jgi:membrane protein